MSFDEVKSVRGTRACCRIRVDDRKAVISIHWGVAPEGWKPGETRVRLLVGRGEDAGQIRLVSVSTDAGFKVNGRQSDDARVVNVPRWPELLPNKKAVLAVVDTTAESITLRLPDMSKALDYVPIRHKSMPKPQVTPQRAAATPLPTQPIKPVGPAVMGRR